MPIRMVYWKGVDPERVENIGSTDSMLAGLSVGETILLRTRGAEAKRKIRDIRIDGEYRELVFEPFVKEAD